MERSLRTHSYGSLLVIHPHAHTHTHTSYHTNAIFKDSCQERTSIHCSNKYPPNLNGFTQQITPCSVLYRAGQHPGRWQFRLLWLYGSINSQESSKYRAAGKGNTQRITCGLISTSAQISTHCVHLHFLVQKESQSNGKGQRRVISMCPKRKTDISTRQ